MKSDRSVVVLHHFGLGRTIGFEAAVSDTSASIRYSKTSLCSNKTAKHWIAIKQNRTISQGLYSFLVPKISAKFDRLVTDRQTDRQTDTDRRTQAHG